MRGQNSNHSTIHMTLQVPMSLMEDGVQFTGYNWKLSFPLRVKSVK